MAYQVALVGSGNMARTHTRAWQKIGQAKIAAVCDRHVDHAQPLASQIGAPAYGKLDALLLDPKIDIIDICTPTSTHKELAVAAARAGKNVFLEKPMALSLADCDEIIRAAHEAGVTVMVGHVVRFFPEYALAKQLVDQGRIGRPAAIRAARLSAHPKGTILNWYADPKQSGGSVLDLIIHDFDWLRWCFGEVDRVFAKGLYGRSEYAGSLDYSLVTLHFASGALAHVCGSWAHSTGFRTQFEICGDGGMIEHDSANSAPLVAALRKQDEAKGSGVAIPESPLASTDDPYYLELRHFVDCLESGAAPMVSLQDARAAVRIALAAIESIQTGLPVSLP